MDQEQFDGGQIVMLQQLEGSGVATYNELQSLMALHIGRIEVFWGMVWFIVLGTVITRCIIHFLASWKA